MRLFMKSVLLLFAVVGLCLCAAQAATPAPTGGATGTSSAPIVKASSAPAVLLPPTIAGIVADTSTSRPATSPTIRTTAPRSQAPVPTTAAPSAKATTLRPTGTPTAAATTDRQTTAPIAEVPTPTADPNLTTPLPTDSPYGTVPTPWTYATTYGYYPTATEDIDPGMTPYSGPTPFDIAEPTPTWEGPVGISDATPTEPPMVIPSFTAEAVESPPFELPPGAYELDPYPSPTETMAPLPSAVPVDAAGSSFLPRWLSYLLFIFLGISGVAAVALVGSYFGSRPPIEPAPGSEPLRSPPRRAKGIRVLQPTTGEPTIEQQALVDRIAGFEPQSMHVERLGQNLLRLEREAQAGVQDRSIRLGRLIIFSAIPSAPVPAPATAWARAHGFRVIAADGSGMALVMPALSNGGRSVLGVLPVDMMVAGTSPVPMPVPLPGNERPAAPRSAVLTGRGLLPASDVPDGS